jgi:hypothetical protein
MTDASTDSEAIADPDAVAEGSLWTVDDFGAGWTDFTRDAPVSDLVAEVPGCEDIAERFPGGSERGVAEAGVAFVNGLDFPAIADIAVFETEADAEEYMEYAATDEKIECERQALLNGANVTLEPVGLTAEVEPQPAVEGVDAGDDLVIVTSRFFYNGDPTFYDDVNSYELRRGAVVATVSLSDQLPIEEQQRLLDVLAQRMTIEA